MQISYMTIMKSIETTAIGAVYCCLFCLEIVMMTTNLNRTTIIKCYMQIARKPYSSVCIDFLSNQHSRTMVDPIVGYGCSPEISRTREILRSIRTNCSPYRELTSTVCKQFFLLSRLGSNLSGLTGFS